MKMHLDISLKSKMTLELIPPIPNPQPPEVIEHYGIKIDKSNPDTSARITYTHDAEGFTPTWLYILNYEYVPMHFEYGSWADAFFMKNNYPAMYKFDGSEDYRLDPADHSKKLDGTASDVDNLNYGGNAMSVFDCHIWMKFYEDENYQYIEVANQKLDEDFVDYPYIRADGSHANKLCYPMYPGYVDSENRLRSISGVKASGGFTAAEEVQYAANNGANWTIGDWSHYLWIRVLMLLISKNFNSQNAFGYGNMSGGSSASSFKDNGLLNTNGQFWGTHLGSDSMKAFYCENLYANRFERLLGFYNDHGIYKIKMTPPYTYDETFDGYTTVASPAVPPPPGGYLKDLSFDKSYGILPKSLDNNDSYSTTYVGDYSSTNASKINMLLGGGNVGGGPGCGPWCLNADNPPSSQVWSVGASVYLKG